VISEALVVPAESTASSHTLHRDLDARPYTPRIQERRAFA